PLEDVAAAGEGRGRGAEPRRDQVARIGGEREAGLREAEAVVGGVVRAGQVAAEGVGRVGAGAGARPHDERRLAAGRPGVGGESGWEGGGGEAWGIEGRSGSGGQGWMRSSVWLTGRPLASIGLERARPLSKESSLW